MDRIPDDGIVPRAPARREFLVPFALAAMLSAAASGQTAIGWGRLGGWQVDTPRPIAEITGHRRGVGIRYADGTFSIRGVNTYGQADVPNGLDRVRHLSVGPTHTLAVDLLGNVRVIGRGAAVAPQPPAAVGGARMVFAAFQRSYALLENGTLVAWAPLVQPWFPNSQLTGVTRIRGVANDRGAFAMSASTNDGRHWYAGTSGQGFLPFEGGRQTEAGLGFALHLDGAGAVRSVVVGEVPPAASEVPAGLGRCVAIATGEEHAIALRADGSVVAWGADSSGETTVATPAGGARQIFAIGPISVVVDAADRMSVAGDRVAVEQPPLGAIENIADIDGGGAHWVAVDRGGAVRAWGDNAYGRASVPAGLPAIREVAAGRTHSVAVAVDGRVYAWGGAFDGESAVPTDLGSVSMIDAGEHHTVALAAKGAVRCWGGNLYEQCDTPPAVGAATAVAAGGHHTLAVGAGGTVYAWGRNGRGQCDVPTSLDAAIAVSGGLAHSMALRADGSIVAWGHNRFGQTNLMPGPTGPCVAIAAGDQFSIALQANGVVRVWGRTERLSDFSSVPLPAPATGIRAVRESGIAILDACPDEPLLNVPAACGCELGIADSDGDRIPDCVDNCADVANVLQDDCDLDGVGDACEYPAGLPDCDGNGRPDECDVAIGGESVDGDGDGLLDSCERARGDLNLDGAVNALDLTILFDRWERPAEGAYAIYDIVPDGVINARDASVVLSNWDP